INSWGENDLCPSSVVLPVIWVAGFSFQIVRGESDLHESS
ncbi:hypothetical protein LCGC14_2778580, partial [marine sediment metagenome]